MVEISGTNITCALGTNSRLVYEAISHGQCGIMSHTAEELCVGEDYMASTVNTATLKTDISVPATKLEKMAIHSIADAAARNKINLASDNVLFILSTTKGNIGLLGHDIAGIDKRRVYLPETAQFIASNFGNRNMPVVVSNACISGLSALILAKRLLDSNMYDDVVVTGVDQITQFTVSGFQSFKALSAERCRPFDVSRNGLNLGEAAATVILSRVENTTTGAWYIEAGAMHNDANHISGPSRVGEGSYRCLCDVNNGYDTGDLAMINAHGTATLYNDEMESIAIDRAGLSNVPVNAYKGYLGHTLGAAGILECILSMQSLDNNTLIKTLGYENIGVSRPLDIINQNRRTYKKTFIKMMSGFGGSNAAVRMRKEVTT